MTKVGFGFDIHKLILKKNSFILLGGYKISCDRYVVAHSDGDVLLHSLSNAILSSIGEDDIGYFFPDSDDKIENISSVVILNKALQLLNERKYHIINVNIDVLSDDIKISPYKTDVKKSLSSLLSIDEECISVHANSFENYFEDKKEKPIVVFSQVLVEN